MDDVLVETPQLAEQQNWDGSAFPLVMCCRDGVGRADAMDWFNGKGNELLELMHKHGAILFRSFPLVSAEDFDGVVGALGLDNFPYRESLSNAVRVNFTERVFSANEAPADVKIFLHHEMAQTPLFPTTILFFCEVASEEGGATPLCRSDVLYERATQECPELVEALEKRGLKYSNTMPSENDAQSGMGRSWKSTLAVESKEEAEARLRELGYSWEWLSDGSLRATTPVLPAVRQIDADRKTLFNQLIAAYSGWKDERNDPSSAIRLGDDTALDAAAVGTLIAIADEISFDVCWRPGDVALVDNTLVMHGRRPFIGKRKVLASLAAKQTHRFSAV